MMAPLAPDYGRRIRLRRQALGLTQEELAARIGPKGVDPSTVVAWELQRHRPTRYQGAIEDVLGISLTDDDSEAERNREMLHTSIDRLSPDQLAEVRKALDAFRDGKQRAG